MYKVSFPVWQYGYLKMRQNSGSCGCGCCCCCLCHHNRHTHIAHIAYAHAQITPYDSQQHQDCIFHFRRFFFRISFKKNGLLSDKLKYWHIHFWFAWCWCEWILFCSLRIYTNKWNGESVEGKHERIKSNWLKMSGKMKIVNLKLKLTEWIDLIGAKNSLSILMATLVSCLFCRCVCVCGMWRSENT